MTRSQEQEVVLEIEDPTSYASTLKAIQQLIRQVHKAWNPSGLNRNFPKEYYRVTLVTGVVTFVVCVASLVILPQEYVLLAFIPFGITLTAMYNWVAPRVVAYLSFREYQHQTSRN